jgi:hypothetical protein
MEDRCFNAFRTAFRPFTVVHGSMVSARSSTAFSCRGPRVPGATRRVGPLRFAKSQSCCRVHRTMTACASVRTLPTTGASNYKRPFVFVPAVRPSRQNSARTCGRAATASGGGRLVDTRQSARCGDSDGRYLETNPGQRLDTRVLARQPKRDDGTTYLSRGRGTIASGFVGRGLAQRYARQWKREMPRW